LPVLAAAAWIIRERLRRKGITYSNPSPLGEYPETLATHLRHVPLALRIGALVLLAVAVLRPQALMGEEEVKLKGINLMLVTDLSGSMVAQDLKPDRFSAEKKVLQDFVGRLPQDQVGLVIFGAKSFTQSPLTLDHEVLRNSIQELTLNTVDADGTAIGDGILTAVNRLAEFRNQTNVIVLATDGTNNRGEDPGKAAEIAAAKKIRIYVVGIGAEGGAPVCTTDEFGVQRPYVVNGKPMRWDEPNDAILRQVAAKTSGEYFRVTDEKMLDAVYARINRLIKDEKQRRDPHYRDLFDIFIIAALGMLLLEAALSATRLRSLS